MKDYLDADCCVQAILPIDNKRLFLAMFLTKNDYKNAKNDAIDGKAFKNGYAYEISEEDNTHGLSAVKVRFLADRSIYDYMLAPACDILLQDICKELGIKRLLAYGKNENGGIEETIQYDNKGKFNYESRDLYPDPFFDCYLSGNEKLIDDTECMD